MSLTTHLTELNEKHKLLKRKIEEELSRPAIDDRRVRTLKSEKLRLKDKITKLREPASH